MIEVTVSGAILVHSGLHSFSRLSQIHGKSQFILHIDYLLFTLLMSLGEIRHHTASLEALCENVQKSFAERICLSGSIVELNE